MSIDTPKLSPATLEALSYVITGDPPSGMDDAVGPYRSKHELLHFFRVTGATVEGPTTESRRKMVRLELQRWSKTGTLRDLVEASVSAAEFVDKPVALATSVKFLNERLQADGYRLMRGARGYRLALWEQADVGTEPAADTSAILTDDYVREQIAKCDTKLATGDLDGAITNARTLIEAVLFALEQRVAGTRTVVGGDLPKQFRRVAGLLHLDTDSPNLEQRFKDVVRGLVQVINGLAPIRNSMSDAHARVTAPAQHHSALVVNASKTVCLFLVQSFNFQVVRGTLKIARAEEDASKNLDQ